MSEGFPVSSAGNSVAAREKRNLSSDWPKKQFLVDPLLRRPVLYAVVAFFHAFFSCLQIRLPARPPDSLEGIGESGQRDLVASAPMEVHADVDGSGVPLAVLLKRELCNQKVERPDILFGEASKSKKGEDFTLLMLKCHRTTGEGGGNSGNGGGENAVDDDTISVFAVMIHWPSSSFWPVFIALNFAFWCLWLHGLRVR